MNSLKTKLKPIKIFGGIIILLLTGVAFGYYLTHREAGKFPLTPAGSKHSENDSAVHEEKLPITPPGNKRPEDDSATRINSEPIPAETNAKPEINPKDGSIKIVEEFIKLHAKNPATFQFLEWSNVTTESGYWKVRCKYRGISSFNAEVTTNAWFYMQNNKVVYTKIISKI